MTKSHFPLLLITLLCAVSVGLAGLLSPFNNWDLIGYIASALSNSGLSGAELHQATYAELLRAVPVERYDLLTLNGPYARGVYADPAALEQQLPFYRIRVLYILTLQAVGQLTNNLAQAIYLVSAASAACLALLTGLLLSRRIPQAGWPAAGAGLIAILYFAGVPNLARLSTPDALFALAALAALTLFYSSRIAGMAILAFLPLIRSDAIVLSALVFVLLLIERDRDLRHYGALAVSATLYVWVNAAYGNYGHAVLFNFSFLPGQRTPYPESLEVLRDPAVYFDAYLRLASGMLTRWVPWILLVTGVAILLERKSFQGVGPHGRLALLAIGYVLLHFLAFPLGASRHYSFALILCCLQIAKIGVVLLHKTRT